VLFTHVAGRVRTFAAVAVAAAGLGVFTASPAQAAPALTVAPDASLVDGQTVTVSGSGYEADKPVFLAQCDVDFSVAPACAAGTAKRVTVAPDGTFTTTVTVRKAFDGVNPATGEVTRQVDCSAVVCGVISVQSDSPDAELTQKAISFD
jgi:hypothetical protein